MLRSQRLTRQEVLAAIRKSGALSPEDVGAVVLETEGTLTVMRDVGSEHELHVLEHVTNRRSCPRTSVRNRRDVGRGSARRPPAGYDSDMS